MGARLVNGEDGPPPTRCGERGGLLLSQRRKGLHEKSWGRGGGLLLLRHSPGVGAHGGLDAGEPESSGKVRANKVQKGPQTRQPEACALNTRRIVNQPSEV